MQRQHKYIVYIPSKKYMGEPRTLFEMTEGHGDISAYPEDTIFREWTGLHDKNGKEIYEGDIVRFRSTGNAYPVVFENGAFRLSGARAYGFTNLEIIGNIYEHPELLKS